MDQRVLCKGTTLGDIDPVRCPSNTTNWYKIIPPVRLVTWKEWSDFWIPCSVICMQGQHDELMHNVNNEILFNCFPQWKPSLTDLVFKYSHAELLRKTIHVCFGRLDDWYSFSRCDETNKTYNSALQIQDFTRWRVRLSQIIYVCVIKNVIFETSEIGLKF